MSDAVSRPAAQAGGAAPAVFVLGAGRAGLALAAALAAAGAPVVGLHGRRARPPVAGLPAVSAGPLPPALAAADVVLVTVRDAQLDEALAELAAAAREGGLGAGAVVLHASGATDPAALATVRAAGCAAGTFHPLLPLAGPQGAAARLRGAWIGVDGDDRARAAARDLATRLGAHVLDVPPGGKARYHAAAVLASNFPAVLAALAARLLREAGVEPEAADGAVRALLAGAVANLADRPLDGASVAAVLTGPAARADAGTIRRHVGVLAQDADVAAVYDALTRAAVGTLVEGGALDGDARDAVLAALAPARATSRP